MIRSLFLFISIGLLFSINMFGQNRVKSNNWEYYQLCNTNMKIMFPTTPTHQFIDTMKIIEQCTYRCGTENILDSNIMYFISSIKYKMIINVDSATMISAVNMIMTNMIQNSFSFKILSQKDTIFQNLRAIRTKAFVSFDKDNKWIFNGLITSHDNYVISMFVLTLPIIGNNKVIDYYFDSLKIQNLLSLK